MNSNYPLLGMDIGGTNARAGLVENGQLSHLESIPIKSNGTVEEVLEQIFDLIERVKTAAVNGIGIAFPSIMDVEKGIVFDVQNIPAWKEVHLKEIIEQRYDLPVRIDNDANCFALGEKYFGQGKNYGHLVGLIVGTGLGAGIVVDGKIYSGANGGAGEFGMIPYRDKYLEYYCSGQFFYNHGNKSGDRLASAATAGDKDALAIFKVFGHHFGQAIKIIQYTVDPEIIILGGSVRKAFPFFKDSMWKTLKNFAFISSLKNIRIAISEDDYIAILGAAALHMSKG